MKKRIFALLTVAALLASLCACGKYSTLSVNGTKIGKGVYAYFTDTVEMNNPDLSATEQKEIINTGISEYVAVNSEFSNRGYSLSAEQKSTLSQTVNSYWRLFSEHYNSIGITKQDIYEIEYSKLCRQMLLEKYYAPDGDKPVSDDELREYFFSHFVAFRAVTGYLTAVDSNNDTVSMTEDERQTVSEVFIKMAEDVNSGAATLDDVAAYYPNTTISGETVVIDGNNTDYPEGVFENVCGIGNDVATSFITGDYIFTVQRNDISSEELNLFSTYRDDCLKAYKGEEFDEVVSQWAQAYPVA